MKVFSRYIKVARYFMKINEFLLILGMSVGMASPLIGIAGVNSLLFAAYGISKRLISPFPQLTLPQTAAAGALAGAINAVLASPGVSIPQTCLPELKYMYIFSGDVQSANARAVWRERRQASQRCR